MAKDSDIVPAQGKCDPRACVQGDGIVSVSYDSQTRSVTVQMKAMAPAEETVLYLPDARRETNGNRKAETFEFLKLARFDMLRKKEIYNLIEKDLPVHRILEELLADRTDSRVMEALNEILTN